MFKQWQKWVNAYNNHEEMLEKAGPVTTEMLGYQLEIELIMRKFSYARYEISMGYGVDRRFESLIE